MNNQVAPTDSAHGRRQAASQAVESIKRRRARCNHCGDAMSVNRANQLQHLDSCIAYSNTNHGEPVQQVETSSQSRNMPAEETLRLQQLAADVCFQDNQSFDMWQTPAMRIFLEQCMPGFRPPTDTHLRRELLNTAYDKMRAQVDEVLHESHRIQLRITGSSEGDGLCLTRLSFAGAKGCCMLETRPTASDEEGVQRTFAWFKAKVVELSGGNMRRISSIAFDTCAMQLTIFKLLNKDPDLTNIITFSCGAHGIALYIQDLLKHPYCAKIFNAAQKIVTHVTTNTQSWTEMRKHQSAFVQQLCTLQKLSEPRWASPMNVLEFVINSRAALDSVAHSEDCSLPEDVKELVIDSASFQDLLGLKALLNPICKHLIAAQAQSSTMEKVLPRWLDIEAHMMDMVKRYPNMPVQEMIDGGASGDHASIISLRQRLKRQMNPHHLAAHLLSPAREASSLTEAEQDALFAAFDTVSDSREAYNQMRDEWFDFQDRTGGFARTKLCWTYHPNDMKRFWQDRACVAPLLSAYAIRLCTTTANTVSSEQPLSALEFAGHRLRHRLPIDKVDKLMFIQANSRVLAASALDDAGVSATTGKRKHCAMDADQDDALEAQRRIDDKLEEDEALVAWLEACSKRQKQDIRASDLDLAFDEEKARELVAQGVVSASSSSHALVIAGLLCDV